MQLRWSWSGTYLSVSRLVWEGQEALIVRVTEAELVAMPVTFGGPGPMDNSSASSWAPNRNAVCFVGDHGRGLVFDADLFQRVPIRNDVVSAGFEQIDGCAWGPSDLAVGRWRGQLEVLNLTTGSFEVGEGAARDRSGMDRRRFGHSWAGRALDGTLGGANRRHG